MCWPLMSGRQGWIPTLKAEDLCHSSPPSTGPAPACLAHPPRQLDVPDLRGTAEAVGHGGGPGCQGREPLPRGCFAGPPVGTGHRPGRNTRTGAEPSKLTHPSTIRAESLPRAGAGRLTSACSQQQGRRLRAPCPHRRAPTTAAGGLRRHVGGAAAWTRHGGPRCDSSSLRVQGSSTPGRLGWAGVAGTVRPPLGSLHPRQPEARAHPPQESRAGPAPRKLGQRFLCALQQPDPQSQPAPSSLQGPRESQGPEANLPKTCSHSRQVTWPASTRSLWVGHTLCLQVGKLRLRGAGGSPSSQAPRSSREAAAWDEASWPQLPGKTPTCYL